MSTLKNTLIALAAILPLAGALAPLTAQTGLTIYPDGRVLVRRTFPVAVPRGASTPTVGIGNADPSTIFALDTAVAIERAVYDAAVHEEAVLRRSVGKRLVFRTGTRTDGGRAVDDTVSALVLGVDPLRLEMPGGRIAFSMPGQPLYPADLVLAEPSVTLALESSAARDRLGLGWFGWGASWQAAYSIVLGRTARVSGSAVINSESIRATDAQVQLIAGDVGRAAAPMPVMARRERLMAQDAAAVGNAVGQQSIGDVHLYTLPGPQTILPGQATAVALFEPMNVAFEKNYVISGYIPYWGYLPQQPEEGEVPVEVSYHIRRPRESEFGDRPLPAGVARVYEADSSGQLQLIGEAGMGHTAPGEDLRLSTGTAFDITARRIQTEYITRRDSTRAGWRTRAEATFRVTITNATDSARVVDVHERRGGEWSILTSSVPPERLSAHLTRFRVTVPARGQSVVTYRVRVVW